MSPVCRAFLALGDDPEPPPPAGRAHGAACAVLAGVVLALGAPLAWASAAPDQPLATPTKAAEAEDGEDEDDGGAA